MYESTEMAVKIVDVFFMNDSFSFIYLLLAEERKARLGSTNFSILSPGRSRLTTPYHVTVETANLGTRAHQTDPLVLVRISTHFGHIVLTIIKL